MRIRIVGSSGSTCTPWPTCTCRVCTQAREKRGHDERYGNHVYLPDHALLTDLSEHIFIQLERHGILDIEHVFISHWHPDHTAGIRIIQAIGGYFLRRTERTLKLYMTAAVRDEILRLVSPAMSYYLQKGGTELVLLEDAKPIEIGSLRVTPVTTIEHEGGPETITYFLFEERGKRFFFAPDETKYLRLDRPELRDLDLLVKECGYFTCVPTGERMVPEDFASMVPDEIPFEDSIEQVRAIGAKRSVLTEIEELFQRTPEDYEALATELGGLIEFAYDGMELDI